MTKRAGFFERLVVKMIVDRLGLKKVLSGKKTYIVGAFMVLQGAYALLLGETPSYGNPTPVSTADAWETISIGLGFVTGRQGIKKVEAAVKNGSQP